MLAALNVRAYHRGATPARPSQRTVTTHHTFHLCFVRLRRPPHTHATALSKAPPLTNARDLVHLILGISQGLGDCESEPTVCSGSI